jgi:hypothetical protein
MEQTSKFGVVLPRAPQRAGHLFSSVSTAEMIDFFQKQAQACRDLAAQATKKNDREYWLHLAQRWEWLVQPPKDVETSRPVRSGRSVLEKRFAKRRAA